MDQSLQQLPWPERSAHGLSGWFLCQNLRLVHLVFGGAATWESAFPKSRSTANIHVTASECNRSGGFAASSGLSDHARLSSYAFGRHDGELIISESLGTKCGSPSRPVPSRLEGGDLAQLDIFRLLRQAVRA